MNAFFSPSKIYIRGGFKMMWTNDIGIKLSSQELTNFQILYCYYITCSFSLNLSCDHLLTISDLRGGRRRSVCGVSVPSFFSDAASDVALLDSSPLDKGFYVFNDL